MLIYSLWLNIMQEMKTAGCKIETNLCYLWLEVSLIRDSFNESQILVSFRTDLSKSGRISNKSLLNEFNQYLSSVSNMILYKLHINIVFDHSKQAAFWMCFLYRIIYEYIFCVLKIRWKRRHHNGWQQMKVHLHVIMWVYTIFSWYTTHEVFHLSVFEFEHSYLLQCNSAHFKYSMVL